MAEFNTKFNRKKKYNFWHSPLVLLILFGIVVLFAYNMVGLVKKQRETSKNKTSEQSKIDDLRKRDGELTQEIEKLNTDKGVEESIRDKFQVVKPGEKMVVIVDSEDKQALSDEAPRDHSFLGFIKRMFKSSK